MKERPSAEDLLQSGFIQEHRKNAKQVKSSIEI